MKRVMMLVTLFLSVCFLFSCRSSDERFPVMVSYGEGVTVHGENPKEVMSGADVEFQIELDNGYIFHSVSEGYYDLESGILKIRNIDGRKNVSFYAERVDYDTETEAVFMFNAEAGDTKSVDGFVVKLGTVVTVRSNYTDKIFLGWSIGKSLANGGTLASAERDYEFRVTPELLSRNGAIYVYANYSDTASNMFIYSANGGTVDASTPNMSKNDYYTAAKIDTGVSIKLSEKYYTHAAAASTFYDDGTFVREGYVLKEYNTKPDGTGEAYSLGSKFYAASDTGLATLYCIWEKETPHSDFEVADYSYPCPVSNPAYAPDWKEEGVIITKYKGDDTTVTIPEMIGGKYVIAIGADAFCDKALGTLVLTKHIQKIADGAFKGCLSLNTVYYPDGLYEISDAAFDQETLRGIKKLYVNATTAPRFSDTGDGSFAVKLSRLLETASEKQIIVIAGSSTYEGLGTEYLEALLSGEYEVVNFGTTRTTHGLIYLEAMQHFASADDIVIYAPENSIYMMGENEMYWKTLRDLEGMNNFFRYIDISGYTNVFSAFSDYNKNYRYIRAPGRYEEIADYAATDKNGDFQRENRKDYNYPNYIDSYVITMNERYKSKNEGAWNNGALQEQNKDYTDPNNPTWQSIDEEPYVNTVNHAVRCAKSSGAAVLFGFCPADYNALVEPAKSSLWLSEYDKLIAELYEFDAVLGSSKDYVFAHEYFYDCAFHMNDYGRTYRTYRLYLDLAARLGLTQRGINDCGTEFDGCIFENTQDGKPKFSVSFGGGA